MRNLEFNLKKIITVVVVIIILVVYTLCFRPLSLLGDKDTAQLESLSVIENGEAVDVTEQVSAADVLAVLESGHRAKSLSSPSEAEPEDGEAIAVVTDSTGTYTITLRPVNEDDSILIYDGQTNGYAVKQSAYLLEVLNAVLPAD